MLPKTSEMEKKLSRAAKTRKVQKKEARLNDWKGLGHFFVIFEVILGSQFAWKSRFFEVKKQHDFEHYLFMFCGVLGMLWGVVFRTLGSSKMSVSSRRNTDFHKIGLPKAHSKNESPQRSENSHFWVNFGPILRAFFVQKRYQKSSKKRSGKKVGKKWSQGGLREIGLRTGRPLPEPSCLLGG
jgi:hypothetical protein